uniref:C2 domain-containing protein n=2 Tax=Steinernema glaseri TaxID=37863 RepID=A0A1I7ZIS7_9BILA
MGRRSSSLTFAIAVLVVSYFQNECRRVALNPIECSHEGKFLTSTMMTGPNSDLQLINYGSSSRYSSDETEVDAERVWSLMLECSQELLSLPYVLLDVFLPNDILVNVKCSLRKNLAYVKTNALEQASKLPYCDLKTADNYVFYGVGPSGDHEELYDESKTLKALNLCLPVLCMVEPEGNPAEKHVSAKIGAAMGIMISELDTHLNMNEELIICRMDLLLTCEEILRIRKVQGTEHYAFPEENHVETNKELVNRAMATNPNSNMPISTKESKGFEVWYWSEEDERAGLDDACICTKITYLKPNEATPYELIYTALEQFREEGAIDGSELPEDFILQVVGKRNYMTKNIYLSAYDYIRKCIDNYRSPNVILRRRYIVFMNYPPPSPMMTTNWHRQMQMRHYDKNNHPIERTDNKKTKILWDLEDYLRIRVHSASHISSEYDLIYVKVTLKIGMHEIEEISTGVVSPANPRWYEKWLPFNLYLKDLPPGVEVVFTLYGRRNRRNREATRQIGYCILRLFDWKYRLLQGKRTLHLWPCHGNLRSKDLFGRPIGLNYMGTGPSLDIEFPDHNAVIQFPKIENMQAYIEKLDSRDDESCFSDTSSNFTCASSNDSLVELDSRDDESCFSDTSSNFTCASSNDSLVEEFNTKLEQIMAIKNVEDIKDEDVEFLWSNLNRISSRDPDCLIFLADSPLIWRNRERVSRLYLRLHSAAGWNRPQGWNRLTDQAALQLLDRRYGDRVVRDFAVWCLDSSLDTEQLLLYLMPLVQALKYEPVSGSRLAQVLLSRALENYRIGHTFFWLLKSELAQQTGEPGYIKSPFYLRICILMESYCSDSVKSIGQKEGTVRLRNQLADICHEMQDMDSPLDPHDRLGTLVVDDAKVLGSAKLPFMLTWTNPEPLSRLFNPYHVIIFKNGDDLRQDMLTLQVMRIMDALWKAKGFDFCMTLYEVLPMGKNIGMIQVVQKCATLFQIHKELTGGFNMEVNLFNEYIKKATQSCSVKYIESTDRFTQSLVGYCVATYVIGITDRHQDNIMLTEDGRLFHIDFGHFLGHTKRKMGIKRDRAPFILTDHFLYVITRGRPNMRETYEYKKFRKLCIEAYMMLHDNARLFITIFRLMICMGLTELQSPEHVKYIENSLCYDLERVVSMSHFSQVFDDTAKNDTATKLNWFSHAVKHKIL